MDGGFAVREGWGTRFTHYAADGELVGTEIGLTTALDYQGVHLGLQAPAAGGGYLAIPLHNASQQAGLNGGPPIDRLPLLRVRRSDSGGWLPPEPIFWQNIRNSLQVIPVRALDSHAFGGQRFGDYDHTAFAHGKVLVMQRASVSPGSLGLIELNTDGDTLWHRRLHFKPLRFTHDWVQEAVDMVTGPEFQFPGTSPAEHREYLEAFEETLYKPEYLPAAQGFFLAASDEVWIKTFERSDTLRVYYTVRRGDMSSEPRRVLLPESFSAEAATSTHVWGTREDPLGVLYVVGRRLTRAGKP